MVECNSSGVVGLKRLVGIWKSLNGSAAGSESSPWHCSESPASPGRSPAARGPGLHRCKAFREEARGWRQSDRGSCTETCNRWNHRGTCQWGDISLVSAQRSTTHSQQHFYTLLRIVQQEACMSWFGNIWFWGPPVVVIKKDFSLTAAQTSFLTRQFAHNEHIIMIWVSIRQEGSLSPLMCLLSASSPLLSFRFCQNVCLSSCRVNIDCFLTAEWFSCLHLSGVETNLHLNEKEIISKYLPASLETDTATPSPEEVTRLHTDSMSITESIQSGPPTTQHCESGQKLLLSRPL